MRCGSLVRHRLRKPIKSTIDVSLSRRVLGSLGLIASLASAGWATECDTSICVGGSSCTISGAHTLSGGCDLNFGDKDVTIDRGALVQEFESGGFSIEARHLTLAGTLQTKTPPGGFFSGNIEVTVSGDFVTPKGAPGRIVSPGGGGIKVMATGAIMLRGSGGFSSRPLGSIELTGASVLVDEKLTTTSAANLTIHSTNGPVTVKKTLRVDSIALHVGCGATVDIQAQGGDLLLNGALFQTNICGAGSLSFSATGNVTINKPINANDKFQGDGGGYIEILAGGDIIINAPITANGSPYIQFASEGGEVLAKAGGNVTVNKTITVNAVDSQRAGCIGLGAGSAKTIQVNGSLEATSSGGNGGGITLGNVPDQVSFLFCRNASPSPPAGADTVILSGSLNSTGATNGVNRISYRTTFDATGGNLKANANSAATGNIVQCACPDGSPTDGVCDVSACINNPVGLNPAQTTPPIQLLPTVLAP